MFADEKAEHPEFTDKQVWMIVRDHFKGKPEEAEAEKMLAEVGNSISESEVARHWADLGGEMVGKHLGLDKNDFDPSTPYASQPKDIKKVWREYISEREVGNSSKDYDDNGMYCGPCACGHRMEDHESDSIAPCSKCGCKNYVPPSGVPRENKNGAPKFKDGDKVQFKGYRMQGTYTVSGVSTAETGEPLYGVRSDKDGVLQADIPESSLVAVDQKNSDAKHTAPPGFRVIAQYESEEEANRHAKLLLGAVVEKGPTGAFRVLVRMAPGANSADENPPAVIEKGSQVQLFGSPGRKGVVSNVDGSMAQVDWADGKSTRVHRDDLEASKGAEARNDQKVWQAGDGSIGRFCGACEGKNREIGDDGKCPDCGKQYAEYKNSGDFLVSVDGGATVSLSEFLKDNEYLDSEYVAKVKALKPGEKVSLGGGAMAETVVERRNSITAHDSGILSYEEAGRLRYGRR
jgi:hypothetical protein